MRLKVLGDLIEIDPEKHCRGRREDTPPRRNGDYCVRKTQFSGCEESCPCFGGALRESSHSIGASGHKSERPDGGVYESIGCSLNTAMTFGAWLGWRGLIADRVAKAIADCPLREEGRKWLEKK